MTTEELLEQFKAEQQYAIELGEALRRLDSNPDFKKVFTNHLFDMKLKQLVDDLATTTAEPLVKKTETHIKAIGSVRVMLSEIMQQAAQAKHNVEQADGEIIAYLTGEQ